MIIKIIREKTPLKCTSCGIVCQTVDSKTSHCINCESDLQCTDAPLFPKQSGNLSRSFFYVNCCQVCNHRHYNSSGKSFPVVSCSHCKMSFYCDETHRKIHWTDHKDLCKAIIAIKSELGSPDIFEKADKSSPESWAQAKIDLILKAESKLGRKLLDNEREMFLFPKTCFACHESNSNLLTTCCKCGISLCETHEDFSEHKDLCKDFHLTFGLDSYFLSTRQRAAPIADKELFLGLTKSMIFKAISLEKESQKLPSSMKAFVETYFQAWEENDWEIAKLIKTSYWKQFIYTDIFSRPLTLLFAMEKFEWSFESMVVHVIGATDHEKSEAAYWEILLHFVPNLKCLKLVYVGPENSDLKLVTVEICGDCLKGEKSLEVEGFKLRYDEYFESESFVKPDIIVGFNLEMHESEYGIMECTWKDTVLTLRKVKAPFMMTSGSELRAEKDFRKLETLLGESVQHCFERNPFGSLAFERDFETERFKFSNHFIIVYTGLYRESERGETFSETTSGLLETRSIYEDLESEREATDEDSESKMKGIAETSESKLESIVSTLETLSCEGESEKMEENLELLERIKQFKGSSYSIKDVLDYDENRIITYVRKNSL